MHNASCSLHLYFHGMPISTRCKAPVRDRPTLQAISLRQLRGHRKCRRKRRSRGSSVAYAAGEMASAEAHLSHNLIREKADPHHASIWGAFPHLILHRFYILQRLKRLHHCLPISHTRAHTTPPSVWLHNLPRHSIITHGHGALNTSGRNVPGCRHQRKHWLWRDMPPHRTPK